MIAIGFLVFAVADSIYLVQTASNTYVSNGLLDVGWPGAMAIISVGAWRRPVRWVKPRIEGWGVFLVPSLHPLRREPGFLRASRREAVIDALTGLGNRRALELELKRRLVGEEVWPFLLAFYDLDGFKTYNDTFGHQADDVLLTRLGIRVAAALPEAEVFRLGGDEFCVLLDESAGGEAAVLTTARALTESGPSQHNEDVAELAVDVCRELGLGDAETVAVRRAAELHDVGKLAVPDAILDKPGPLDESEWAFMRQHTIVGERIVASATSLRDVAPIIRASHERWDGGGYPDGLAGDAIPLGARVIAACDAHDAMTTMHSYRAAMNEASAMIELRRCAGQQFDPHVVAAFERVIARGRAAAPERLAA